jgi:dipeptidyl aminopeptidase/acylaminoacyl peptidase
LVACSGGGGAGGGATTPAGSPARSGASAAATALGRVVVERNRTLFVLDGGGERRISTQGFYPGGNRATEPPIAVSPNRRWVLAYTATRPGWFVLPVAGGGPFRLPGAAKLPVWSSDSTIAYVADGDLHLVVPGRRDVALLAPAPEGCCFGLAWSADGRRIAMEGFDRTLGHEQVWVVDRTGRNLKRVWAGRAGKSPAGRATGFSPEGEWIVTSNADKPMAIEIGGPAHELEGDPVLEDHGFTWWRNRLLVRTRAEPSRLAWEDPGGGDLIVLPEPVAFATKTALAPSGSPLGVTLVRREDSKTALFTVRPDGTALKRLTDWGEAVAAIGWSGDGRWLVAELAKSHAIRAVLVAKGTASMVGSGRLRAVL